MPVCPKLHIYRKHADFIQISLCNIFYISLKETWLLKRESDATSARSEPGGK